MNTKKTVFSKIAKGMPKKQVKLGLIDNFYTEFSNLEDELSTLSYLAYDWFDEKYEAFRDAFNEVRSRYNLDDYIINGATRDLEEVSEIIGQALSELEFKAQELGVDPNDILSNFDDLIRRVDNAESLNRDAFEKYQEARQYAGFNDFWR
jgi:hypothetical protein